MMAKHTTMNTLPYTRPYPTRKEDRDAARLLRNSSKVARPEPSSPPRVAKSQKSTIKPVSTAFKSGSRAHQGAGPAVELPSSPPMARSQSLSPSRAQPVGTSSYLPSPPTSPSRSPLPAIRKRKSVDEDDAEDDEKKYDGRAASPNKKRVVVDIRNRSSSRTKDVECKMAPFPPSPTPSSSSTLFDEPTEPSNLSSEDKMMSSTPTYAELLAAHLELKAVHSQLEAKYAADTTQPDSLRALVAEAVRQGLKDEREAEQRRRRDMRADRSLVARALGGASTAYSAIRLGRGLYRDGMWAMGRIAYGKAQLGGLPPAWDLVAAVQERLGFL